MKKESRHLGTIHYESKDMYTFPEGIAPYEDHKKYVLVTDGRTSPAMWLVSLDEGGPELALLDAGLLHEQVRERDLRSRALRVLEADSLAGVRVCCVLTVPDQPRKASANLRAPILLNPATGRGWQHIWPDRSRKPVRKQVWGDLARPGDLKEKRGMVISHRKVGETLEIGPDVTVQVMELADGGVRLGVYAPREVAVNRGTFPATVKQETRRASEETRLESVEELMRGYRASHGARDQTAASAVPAQGSARASQHVDAGDVDVERAASFSNLMSMGGTRGA